MYKPLLRSFVRSSRASRVLQLTAANKRETALLNYSRLQRIRQGLDTAALDTQLAQLQQRDPARDRSLLFLPDTAPLRALYTQTQTPRCERTVEAWADACRFLDNQREYGELMRLYDLSGVYTQEERVQATANRVGLQVPAN